MHLPVSTYFRSLGTAVTLNCMWNELGVIAKRDIVGRVNDWELSRWREEVGSKSTLNYYRAKDIIGGEGGYDNSWGSVLLYRVRSNSLRLGWRERFFGGEVACVVCGAEEETLLHFLEECEGLREARERYSLYRVEDVLSFGGGNWECVKRYLEEIWGIRQAALGDGTER